jgi:hypothetical protein
MLTNFFRIRVFFPLPALLASSSIVRPSDIISEEAYTKGSLADGNVGQVGEKIGGPFSKDGAIGSQFDASKDGIAGTVEKAVDGPSNPAKNPKQ